jgi:anti-sigma factor RsiW
MRLTNEPTGFRIGEDEIQAFVDDVLDDSRRNELLAHIAVHPHEAERVNAYFRQRALLVSLRASLSDDDDATFCVDLQRKLQASMHRQRGFRVALRMAAAIAVMLPLGAGGWLAATHLRAPSNEPQAVAHDTSGGPEFPFGGSFETAALGGAPPVLQVPDALLPQLDGTSLTVPDLASVGLTLLTADTLPDVTPPAARLIYNDGLGNQLLVFIGLASSTAPQALAVVPEGHLSMSWRTGSLVYAVVAPMQMPQLHEVVRLISEDGTEVAGVPAAAIPDVNAVEIEPAVMPDVTTVPGAPANMIPADQTAVPLTPVTDEIGQEQPKVL